MPKELKFPEVCVVDASAGSGKTYALAKRYLQLLINPSLKPEEIPMASILAITFTNKATIEMKERILEFLKKIALNSFSSKEEEKELLDSLGVSREEAQKKAYRIIDYLMENYDYFQVQTIDSFINSLITGCSFKLDISPNFQIKTDYNDYLLYCLDSLIDRAAEIPEVREMFSQFLKQYLLVENNSGWFPKKNIFNLVNSLFSESNKQGALLEKHSGEKQNILLKKKEIISLMKKLADNLPEGTDKRFEKSLTSTVAEDNFDIDNLSKYFQREELPLNKGYQCPDNIRQTSGKLWDRIKKGLTEFCEEEAYNRFNCYLDIFNLVLENFRKVASKDDIIFLEELNRKARLLFDEKAMTVPELYYRLSVRFHHYLIDEFQDTSRLQWKNLQLMVEDALSTGGSLFYVGDKKQAIYRFRGGDSNLFDEVKEEFRQFNLNLETLSKNYRSQKEIVEFNNEIFSSNNLRRFFRDKEAEEKGDGIKFIPADINDIVSVYEHCQQDYTEENKEGYVRVEFIPAEDREEGDNLIKDKVMKLIKELKERFDYKDIAILTRSNDEVEQITTWLLEESISVESEKTLNVRENSLIKELVSFLRFLNSPIDDFSFASFILGDIFTQATGIDKQVIHNFLFNRNRPGKKSEQRKEYLYKEFSENFSPVWNKFLDEFFKNVGFTPLYEFVVNIIDKFEVLKNFSAYQGFFMNFLELIKKQEKDYNTIDSFLEYFSTTEDEDLYVNTRGTDSIKILTVHKAKGLEFNVVLIPFLKIEVKVGTQEGRYVVQSENDKLFLLYLKKSYNSHSSYLEGIYRQEYKKSFIDELNNIYVAFTRAKNELYVFIPGKSGRSKQIVQYLIPWENTGQNIIERGKETSKQPVTKPGERTIMELPVSCYIDWLNLLQDEFIGENYITRRETILQGKIIHYLLSYINNLSQQDQKKIISVDHDLREEAILQARREFPFVNDFTFYAGTVKKLMDEQKCQPFFFVEEGEVYTEKEIVDVYGNTRRIDRLIVKKDEVWVVDYKSFKEESSVQKEQIAEYLKLVKEIYPGKKVRGFLIYWDTVAVEEI